MLKTAERGQQIQQEKTEVGREQVQAMVLVSGTGKAEGVGRGMKEKTRTHTRPPDPLLAVNQIFMTYFTDYTHTGSPQADNHRSNFFSLWRRSEGADWPNSVAPHTHTTAK